jgi:hypothetical protein
MAIIVDIYEQRMRLRVALESAEAFPKQEHNMPSLPSTESRVLAPHRDADRSALSRAQNQYIRVGHQS